MESETKLFVSFHGYNETGDKTEIKQAIVTFQVRGNIEINMIIIKLETQGLLSIARRNKTVYFYDIKTL